MVNWRGSSLRTQIADLLFRWMKSFGKAGRALKLPIAVTLEREKERKRAGTMEPPVKRGTDARWTKIAMVRREKTREKERRKKGERDVDRERQREKESLVLSWVVMVNRGKNGREEKRKERRKEEKRREELWRGAEGNRGGGEDGIMRCRFRDDAEEKERNERREEGGWRDGEKRWVTTPMEKKIERMERGADLSKRQFRNYERGTGSVERPAGRNEIVSRFSSSATGPRPHRVDRARGHNPFSIRIVQRTSCIYFTRLPPFSCYFKYHRSRAGRRTIDNATRFALQRPINRASAASTIRQSYVRHGIENF